MTTALRRGLGLPGMGGFPTPAFIGDDLYRKAGQIPTLDCRFAQDLSLAARRFTTEGVRLPDLNLTFSRADAKTVQLVDGSMGEIAAGTPTFSFSRGISQGLDLWPSNSNIALFSEEFDNAAWGFFSRNGTVTPNTVLSPRGTLTADTMTADGAASSHSIAISLTATAVPYAWSCFLKANTCSFVQMRFSAALGAPYANFDIANGIVGTVANGTAGATTAYVEPWGDGWYRCVMITTPLAATGGVQLLTAASLTDGAPAAPAVSTAYHPWGAQLEQASIASPYIGPTLGSAVGRTQDNCSTTDLSWLDQSGGLFYAEYTWNAPLITINRYPFSCDDGSTSNRINVFNSPNGTNHQVARAGIQFSANSVVTLARGGRLAHAYQVGHFSTAGFNGVQSVPSASALDAAITALATLWVGRWSAGEWLNGTIARLAYFPPGPALRNIPRIITP